MAATQMFPGLTPAGGDEPPADGAGGDEPPADGAGGDDPPADGEDEETSEEEEDPPADGEDEETSDDEEDPPFTPAEAAREKTPPPGKNKRKRQPKKTPRQKGMKGKEAAEEGAKKSPPKKGKKTKKGMKGEGAAEEEGAKKSPPKKPPYKVRLIKDQPGVGSGSGAKKEKPLSDYTVAGLGVSFYLFFSGFFLGLSPLFLLQFRLSSLTARIHDELDRKNAAAETISTTMSDLQKELKDDDYNFVELIENLCMDTTVQDKVRDIYAAFFNAVISFFNPLFLDFLTFFFAV